MKTTITTNAFEAADFLRRGGIVAFPTETVYGLGANTFDEKAIGKVFEAKRRPGDNPLIAHVSTVEQVRELAKGVTPNAERLIKRFFPGPLTVVLIKSGRVPYIATAGLDTIGIRMPRNRLANDLISACGTPIVAPSANISGRPSPTTWQAVFEDLNGRIDCILKGEPTEIGLESTVVDCTADPPRVLRPGAVSIEQLREVLPRIEPAIDVGDMARSPGMRHRHYSPRAKVVLMNAGEGMADLDTAGYIGLSQPASRPRFASICSDVDEYARALFHFFRECDRIGLRTIYCETVAETGVGQALMDRLRRAAEA